MLYEVITLVAESAERLADPLDGFGRGAEAEGHVHVRAEERENPDPIV